MEFAHALTAPPAEKILSTETMVLAERVGRMIAAGAAAHVLECAAERELPPGVAGRMAECAALVALKAAARALGDGEHSRALGALLAIADLMLGRAAGVAAFPDVADVSIAGHREQLRADLDRVKVDLERAAAAAMSKIGGVH